MTANALPIGHNAPPDIEPLRERLDEQYAHLRARAAELLETESRIPDTLAEGTVGRAADFERQIKACVKAAQAAHKAEKAEFLDACNTCDAWLNGIRGPLLELAKRINRKVTTFLDAKDAEERKRREEEARRLDAEATALASAGKKDLAREVRAEAHDLRYEARHSKPADLVRTHTGMGGVATLKQHWVGEITDRHALDLEVLRPYIPILALEQALRAYVRAGGRELAGCKIYQDREALVK
jgi:hypothetical protein